MSLLETDNYYPFGLSMAGISSKAAGKLENLHKFNKGSELQHKEFSDGSGLEVYDTEFRQFDPQTGRWNEIDPDIEEGQESVSPYQSMADDPIRYNDPLGNVPGEGFWSGVADGFTGVFKSIGNAINHPVETLKNAVSPESLRDYALDAATGGIYSKAKEAVDATQTVINEGAYGAGKLVGQTTANVVIAVATDEVVKGVKGAFAADVKLPEMQAKAQVTKNLAQGTAFEKVVTKALETEGHTDIAQQVTIKPNGGGLKNVRLDNVSRLDGEIKLTDPKSSAKAPLTTNQKVGYPAIEQNGGVVVGKKGASQGYPAGTIIPPTKVDIRRP